MTKVPLYTAAAGLRFERKDIFHSGDGFILSLISKFVGSQDTINASCPASLVNGVCPTPVASISRYLNGVNGIIPAYNQFDLSLSYHFLNYSIEGQILKSAETSTRSSASRVSSFWPTADLDLTNSTFSGPYGSAGPNANAPEYQVPTNFQITLKAKF